MMPLVNGSRFVFGLVVASYLVGNLGASLVASKKTGQSTILLPVVFATLHTSYGLGFLVGLARFWNCWGSHKNRLKHFDEQKQELGRA